MSPDQLLQTSAWRIQRHIATGEVSPVEIVQASLDRIQQLDCSINAFISVCPELALAEAKRAEQAVRAGKPLGPLHGVPIAVKDDLWAEGLACTAGSKAFSKFIPPRDGTAMKRLRQAGAILVGKTNTPEFMCWSRTANKLLPETVNPMDPRRSPGASSGGSAAALAAGMVPLAIGSDGGGSIRIPAALCGVAGLFPTPGRIPDTGSFSCSPNNSLGPMARDVRDLLIALEVMAGPDDFDLRTPPQLPPLMEEFSKGIEGLRCAFSPDLGHITLEAGIADTVRSAALGMRTHGAVIEEIDWQFHQSWPLLRTLNAVHQWQNPDVAPAYIGGQEFLSHCREQHNFSRLTEYGKAATASTPLSEQELRESKRRIDSYISTIEKLFKHFDLLLTPTMPCVAPLLPPGLKDPYPFSPQCCGTYFTAIANIARLPAASVPCGLINNLPVGIQIIAPHGREDLVLRASHQIMLNHAQRNHHD